MREYQPIETVHDLLLCDDKELLDGYWSGFNGESVPGSDKSKSFWHGWRNGRVDGGHTTIDVHQTTLAKEYVKYQHIN